MLNQGTLIAAAALAAAGIGFAAPAFAGGEANISVVVSPSANRLYSSWGTDGVMQANSQALEHCQREHKDCYLVGNTTGCMTVGINNGQVAVGYGHTKEEATQQFMNITGFTGVDPNDARCAFDPAEPA
jgi:hypothetical protein